MFVSHTQANIGKKQHTQAQNYFITLLGPIKIVNVSKYLDIFVTLTSFGRKARHVITPTKLKPLKSL